MRLTVGMAAYKDFDTIWFTIQALRLYQDLTDTEILVVDNFGDDRLQSFIVAWCQGTARYVRWTDVAGSAPAKGRVFQEARGDWVVCIDPHILLAPNALKMFKQWTWANPGCRDLLQGPLLYDGLDSACDAIHGDFGGDGVWGQWRSGMPALDEPPYVIEKQGMGLFGCRRDSWLGFAPGLRGFGGEEGVIHEKYRRAGRQTLCLPFMRWNHLFRKGAAPYPLDQKDKARNYLLGFRELGLDTAPVFKAFGAAANLAELELKNEKR